MIFNTICGLFSVFYDCDLFFKGTGENGITELHHVNYETVHIKSVNGI